MNLLILSAADRLREAQGKTTMTLFGPSGISKTSLLPDSKLGVHDGRPSAPVHRSSGRKKKP